MCCGSCWRHKLQGDEAWSVQRHVPTTPARADHDYYRDKHMPMLKRLMGDAARSTHRQGPGRWRAGPAADPCGDVPRLYRFGEARWRPSAHAKQIMGDVPNYTDIKPVAQMMR